MNGVFCVAGTRRVGNHLPIRDYVQVFVRDDGDVECSLVVGLVKRRKGAASVGVFELSGRVFPALIVFADVEAAQFIIQFSGVANLNCRWTLCKRLVDRQVCHLLFFVERDMGGLVTSAAGDGHRLKVNARCVEDDLRGGLQHTHLDGFYTREGVVRKVWRETQFVAFRICNVRKALCHAERSQ